MNLDFFSSNKNNGRYYSIALTPSVLATTINWKKGRKQGTNKEALSLKTMRYCSRFDSCPAPKCPLDPLINIRSETDWDPVCGMAKATRHKYWESMPEDFRKVLPFQGYFRAEYNRMQAAKKRWDSLSEDEKNRMREIGKARLMASRGAKS